MKSCLNFLNLIGVVSFVRMTVHSSFFIFGSLSVFCGWGGGGWFCFIFVKSARIQPMSNDIFLHSLLCSSMPAIILSTTFGSSSMRMVVPTSMSLHLHSYLCHLMRRYLTVSLLELIIANLPSTIALYCFLHLM